MGKREIVGDWPFASASLTAGELNALTKIVGGRDKVKMVLAGRARITVTIIEPEVGKLQTEMVVCQANGTHCTVCGGYIDEGDICVNRHVVGQSYPKT
jgi:hypothetical protein